MNSPAAALATAGYAIGALGFAAFATQLLLRRSRTVAARRLLAAVVAGTLWEACGLVAALNPLNATWLAHGIADAVRYGAWIFFLMSIMPAAGGVTTSGRVLRRWLPVAAVIALIGAEIASLMANVSAIPAEEDGPRSVLAISAWLVASIGGLVLCEQLFRSVPGSRRWAIKPLCIGLAAAFAFDLFMFADGLLLRGIDPELWGSRGLVHALTLPLILVATARNRDWTIDVAVSRGIVFGSTALLLSGVYLLTVAGAGYFVRTFGGEWGRTAQVTFLFASLLTLVVVFTSGTVRARLRVFINKNFFSYRYDYRQEWLGFTQTLATPAEGQGIYERVVQGLADLVESPGGIQWWRQDDGGYRVVGRLNSAPLDAIEPAGSALTAFLERTGWVIDLNDVRRRVDHYEGLEVPTWAVPLPQAWLVVPMMGHDGLSGFTVLLQPRTPVDLNWEVLDLLKTAARQAMAFLGHVQATEALVQAQQFEAFNRMSAFLVHDLKNLVAQQSLMLKNAERHSGNPEFQRDMLDTVRHVVERMNRLLLQLRSGTAPVANPAAVDVSASLGRLAAYHAPRAQRVEIEATPGLRVLAHEERLERVLGHLIQNAFDAMDGAGTVRVRVRNDEGKALIEVEDEGKGMSPEFIRDGLFKPFVSTKSTGMGIGAYESREYVNELGGSMEVASKPGAGTTFVVRLPLAGLENEATSSRRAA
ncbi:MAG: XrtA/PEP-CTERM system histidine kinase PrsK [Betaproteobacteria bacterium]